MPQRILTNARIVTADSLIDCGTVVISGESIADIYSGVSGAAGAIDCEGDFLLPGLVELHTDNLERHFTPRPSVIWPAENAVLGHDAQICASGITTVFDAVAIGDIGSGSIRIEGLDKMLAAIRRTQAAGMLRADHLLHIRCEISFPSTAELFRRIAGSSMVRLVSIMDHTPGQRQFVDPEKLRVYYTSKYRMSDDEFSAFVAARQDAHRRYSARHRAEIVGLSRDLGYALASHDDATADHVREAVADGMTIAEFPTTIEAADASHAAGLAVLVGGPNIVLGGSHSGNVAAQDLAHRGVADIISSDYVPTSILQALFRLVDAQIGIDLPTAVRMVSLNPARAVGLDDRGEIVAGKRADLARVRIADSIPFVREVWRQGQRVL